ncbi:MAG: alpha/beta hydrolase [Candidatus Binatia bacterium]
MSAAPRSDHLTLADGRRLHVVRWGDPAAPPVLCIHGAAAHAHWWDRIAPALLPAHHVIAPDLRGHGRSDRARAYLIEDFAADCLALLDASRAASAALIGHSMGGRVAAWIAAHHPARGRKLALLDARLGAVPRERAERWRGGRPAAAAPRTWATRAEAEAAFRLAPPEPDVPADALAAVAAHAVARLSDGRWTLAVDRAVLSLDGSRIVDLLPVVVRVRCPLLLLRGRDSTVIGAAQCAALQAALPDAVVETVAGGHHFLLANPDRVGARLATFLEP